MAFNITTEYQRYLRGNRRVYQEAVVSPADKAIEERNRTFRQYRKALQAERLKLFESSQFGELLRKFAATLNHFSLDSEPRMVEYVRQQQHEWLRNADDKFRNEALRLINERCMRNRLRKGQPPLNDPLPGQPDDTFRLCKAELGL